MAESIENVSDFFFLNSKKKTKLQKLFRKVIDFILRNVQSITHDTTRAIHKFSCSVLLQPFLRDWWDKRKMCLYANLNEVLFAYLLEESMSTYVIYPAS